MLTLAQRQEADHLRRRDERHLRHGRELAQVSDVENQWAHTYTYNGQCLSEPT